MNKVPKHWHWRADLRAEEGSGRLGPGVLIDVDGVISDATHRQHYLDSRPRDWDGFFEAAAHDLPLIPGLALLATFDRELTIVLLTARPLRIRPLTLDWLERHNVVWDLLVMRPDGDNAPSSVTKLRAVEELRAVGLEPRLAVDDDQNNVDAFSAAGIPAVYHHSGYYE